jgi:hypothetical protein
MVVVSRKWIQNKFAVPVLPIYHSWFSTKLMFIHDFLIVFGLRRDILVVLRSAYLTVHNMKYNLVLCGVHLERYRISFAEVGGFCKSHRMWSE